MAVNNQAAQIEALRNLPAAAAISAQPVGSPSGIPATARSRLPSSGTNHIKPVGHALDRPSNRGGVTSSPRVPRTPYGSQRSGVSGRGLTVSRPAPRPRGVGRLATPPRSPYGGARATGIRPAYNPSPATIAEAVGRPQLPQSSTTTWNQAARAGANGTGAKASVIARTLGPAAQVAGAVGLSLQLAEETRRLINSTTQTFRSAYDYGATGNRFGMGIAAAAGPGTAAAAAVGAALGSRHPVTFGPGAAPGAGALALGAAAAGAGLAALSGWVDPSFVSNTVQNEGFIFGDLYCSYDRNGFPIQYFTASDIRSDYHLEYRQNITTPHVRDEAFFVVWDGVERYLAGTNAGGLSVVALSFTPRYTEENTVNTSPSTESDHPIKAPLSTREPNPPRLPAPSTPRSRPPLRLPSPLPTDLPQAEPIPPGILPNGSPLTTPTAPADPTEAPQADPTNVPNRTPRTPPSITPTFNPQEPGDYTGTDVIDTPTGPAEVYVPPGGLSETPTGATVQTDKPVLEPPNDDWLIWPLLIGGGLAAGTAIANRTRVDDPTTPGRFTQTPRAPTPPRIDRPSDNPCRCNGPVLSALNGQTANTAAMQAQLTRIEANQNNPLSGFGALQAGQAGILGLLQSVNSFMRKAWEMTRMQKVLDVLTFIGVMHNVSMLSRGVGSTFLEVVGQAVQAVGIRDEEGQVLDVHQMVTGGVETFLRAVLGDAVYEGTAEAWNKANRIISSASMIIWTVRSLFDTSLDLMEWIGENTGKIGNALKRWGVIGERDYPWMSERAQAQSRIRSRFNKVTGALENTEDRISTFGIATSGVIEAQEETAELGENFGRFKDSVIEGIPDPWADNEPIKTEADAAKAAAAALPDIPVADSQKG